MMNIINRKPFISIVVPGYNEAGILKKNLEIIYNYMRNLESEYDWELIFVNDGSSDKTGKLADEFALCHPKMKVVHHKVNQLLGSALRTGFKNSSGDYIITLDLDLSYSPGHIERLLSTIRDTEADVVIASCYMKGGKVTNVPFFRRIMSRYVNLFLLFIAREKIHTFTGMVRAYNGTFLKHLVLKARDNEINPEIIYKTILLRGRIVEIPAHLDWSAQKKEADKRKSKIRIVRGILSGFMSGFIFRPYIFFIGLGLLLITIALYVLSWIFINTFSLYPYIQAGTNSFIDDKFSMAVAELFKLKPHAFLIGGFVFIIAVQFLSLGFLSLQSKRYFEELFNLNTNMYKNNLAGRNEYD
jgi:glycosyltransferase involved in cell wall biosynthesis